MLLANNSGGSSQNEYVDSLFSTYLYTGNGGVQTINNGIDLAGKGGLVWTKNRNVGYSHHLTDSTNLGKWLHPDTTDAIQISSVALSTFNNNGYVVPLDSSGQGMNYSGETYVSWTFRKAPKFFDVVTYTGDGVAGRQIPHSLGVAPGFILIKCTSTGGSGYEWIAVHKDTWSAGYMFLNSTMSNGGGLTVSGDASNITLASGWTPINQSGQTYVAYLFAHDPSADGIIQCGSFTTDGSGNATVTLGWEPQFLLHKSSSGTGSWVLRDVMRGMDVTAGGANLTANTSNAESNEGATNYIYPTATGFGVHNWSASNTSIYVAIRRPNKPPTTGTQVYNAIARTGTGAAATVTGVGFAPDFVTSMGRSLVRSTFFDRLRAGAELRTRTTDAETANTQTITEYGNASIKVGTDGATNSSGDAYINHFFRRAPGFFSSFAYTGTGSNTTQSHDLAAIPDLLIVKSRSAATDWQVWCNGLAANEKLVLNSTAGKVTDATAWNSTLPTSTNISLGTASATNANTATFIAYAFSNLPGIQKIGTYVGDGTSGRVIDCGFSTGARFVCIKAISTTGSWLVADSTRGIVSGNDPYLQLNSTAAEVTTEDWLDPASIGFIVNNVASSNANTNGVTYMFWAIS